MRVKHSFPLEITHDEGALIDRSDVAAVTLDGHDEALTGSIALVADVPYSIPFTGMDSVNGVQIVYEGDAAISINGSVALPLRRGLRTATTRASSATLVFEGLVDSLVITPVTAGRLTWAAWGEPAIEIT